MSQILQSIINWVSDVVFSQAVQTVKSNAVDGTDNTTLVLAGGGGGANGTPGRGAVVELHGNETGSFAGAAYLIAGDAANAFVSIRAPAAAGQIGLEVAGATRLTIPAAASFKTVAANESTGAGTALLATNCPASTVSAPFTWIKVNTSDGSVCYFPVWK